jgi:hypothetical protein
VYSPNPSTCAPRSPTGVQRTLYPRYPLESEEGTDGTPCMPSRAPGSQTPPPFLSHLPSQTRGRPSKWTTCSSSPLPLPPNLYPSPSPSPTL